MRSKFFQKIFYNWQAKVISFLLAVFVYFILVYSIRDSRIVNLPVNITYPEGYIVTSRIDDSVELVIQGTEERIYLLDVSKFSLSADFSSVDGEGVHYADIKIDVQDLMDYVDVYIPKSQRSSGDADDSSLGMKNIAIYTNPSRIKLYFSLPDSASSK